MLSITGRILRGLLRLVFAAGLLAGLVALARKVIGEASGEPGVPPSTKGGGARSPNGSSPGSHRGVPMSFDSWPPVPPAGRPSD